MQILICIVLRKSFVATQQRLLSNVTLLRWVIQPSRLVGPMLPPPSICPLRLRTLVIIFQRCLCLWRTPPLFLVLLLHSTSSPIRPHRHYLRLGPKCLKDLGNVVCPILIGHTFTVVGIIALCHSHKQCMLGTRAISHVGEGQARPQSRQATRSDRSRRRHCMRSRGTRRWCVSG